MIRELKFKWLTQRYSDEIYRFVRGMLKDPAEAEDATQEILLRLWQHLPEVRLSTSRAWLYQTARNYCRDLLRRRQAKHRPLYLGDDETPEPVCDRQSKATAESDLTRLRNLLDEALDQLPEAQRSVFVLYEINRLRYQEIADTLDIPINSVKVYLSRARQKLQSLLKEEKSWIDA